MKSIQIYRNPTLGAIRMLKVNGEPWFVGKDISDILGYQNGSRDINRHVDPEDMQKTMLFDGMQDRETIIINESGMYSFIMGSKLEAAKTFKRWVTSEVLPSIRKNGGYIQGQETLSDDELLAKALLVAQNKIAEKDQVIQRQAEQIKTDRPKVLFADAILSSSSSIYVEELAKLIKQNGIDIGRNRLFTWLRDNGYLIARENLPKQKYMDMGLFEIKENTIPLPGGETRISFTTKVTPKGQQYFINKFLNA